MSYSGFTERLCVNGHYSSVDAWCEPSRRCDCGELFRYTHGVDQTNGYDESHPATCCAPKVEIGHEDVWSVDPYGNRYATLRRLYAPAGDGIWIKINSEQQATPPYPDDIESAIEAQRAETAKTGSVEDESATLEEGDAQP